MSEGLAAGSVGCEFECWIASIRGGYLALIWRVVTLLSESSDGREPGSQPPETGSSVIRPLLMSQTIADPLTAQSPHSDLFTAQSECMRMSLSLLPDPPDDGQGSPTAGPVSRDQTGPCLAQASVCHCGHCSSSAPARPWPACQALLSPSQYLSTCGHCPVSSSLPSSPHITHVTQHPS